MSASSEFWDIFQYLTLQTQAMTAVRPHPPRCQCPHCHSRPPRPLPRPNLCQPSMLTNKLTVTTTLHWLSPPLVVMMNLLLCCWPRRRTLNTGIRKVWDLDTKMCKLQWFYSDMSRVYLSDIQEGKSWKLCGGETTVPWREAGKICLFSEKVWTASGDCLFVFDVLRVTPWSY